VYSSDSSDKTKTPSIIYNLNNNCLDSIIKGKVVSIKLFDKIIVQISVDEDLIGGGEGGMRQKLKMELVEPFVPGLSVSNNNGGSAGNNENIEDKSNNRKKDKRENTDGGRKKKVRV